MNREHKQGFIFGVVMTISLFVQSMFTNEAYGIKDILRSLLSAVIGGVVGGLLYGWLINKFSASKMAANRTGSATDPSRESMSDSPEHLKGREENN